MKKWVGLILLSTALTGCGSSGDEPEEIHVMAAASLTDALGEIQSLYEEEENVKLIINYGSSGKLREQITQGAPADLFLSASISDMEVLEEEGDVSESVNLLMNQLVFISTPEVADSLSEWDDLLDKEIQGIAMGQPESVPAGRYSLQAFESLEMWDDLKDNVIYGSDVRQVLTYVETGNTDVGIVYQTDALSSDKVEMIASAPEGSHDPIHYPIGLLESASDKDAAVEFYQYLQTEEPIHMFETYGFEQGT
ncbi:molybdate ABC transporter substrate-binding protein [Alkalicoccobacillus murimartini]|uniref:Molybdate transport system substrate-binding protein n=1 Tax=Alkalicoccobacillus murimartini TaxID=171685 RepID=A0ABT9YNW9_9BACI|nr:molybdate ABC transporter substrate-binding protein [Alkalicoccobacillus murimartini]MDQ0208724.1 molybdate transport system substrate-binding protein [Alkalicoccobacillus murimartini]